MLQPIDKTKLMTGFDPGHTIAPIPYTAVEIVP